MGRDGTIGLFRLLFRQEVDNENTPETGGGTNWLRLTEIPKKNRNSYFVKELSTLKVKFCPFIRINFSLLQYKLCT